MTESMSKRIMDLADNLGIRGDVSKYLKREIPRKTLGNILNEKSVRHKDQRFITLKKLIETRPKSHFEEFLEKFNC